MEKKLYICVRWNRYSKEAAYTIREWKPSEDSGEVILEERDIQFETPNDKALRVSLAKALQLKLRAMRVEHFTTEKEVEETIQELQALEFKPDTQPEDGVVS